MKIFNNNRKISFIDNEGNSIEPSVAIYQLRAKNGWTRSDLGNECGCSPRTVEGWELGRAINPAYFKILEIIFTKSKKE